MAGELTERVPELVEAQGIPESEGLEQALERGVEALWVDMVLFRDLEDEIDRERAIGLVSRDRIKRAERELQAVEDVVQWGLDA